MPQNELKQYGVVRTHRMRYAPLDEVRITFEQRLDPENVYRVEVCDGAGRPYFRSDLTATDGLAEVTMTAGGMPGLHAVRVFRESQSSSFMPHRMGSFILTARTEASAEGEDVAGFFTWLEAARESYRDWARYDGKWVVGHKAADNSPMNLAYPLFYLDANVYFDSAAELKTAIDLCYAHQNPDGSLYDHVYADGSPGWGADKARKIRSMMADLEIGLIINVHQVWMATGDAAWVEGLMAPMLRGWRYATSSPVLWDETHRLIKRPHTADEWDFQMGDNSCFRNHNSKYAVALCDAVRLPKAADALAAMLDALGRAAEAAELRHFAADARQRANDLLWDGAKYRHHEHLDPVDHGDFDEDDQLVMSNSWACTDGLAAHEQVVAIIQEYERRLRQSGDRYPWWSLQPGYPEGHFPGKPPGFYANGGLFPLVGADLCRACFRHGFAERGWRLFREFWQQVKSDNGACVTWYTLDGRAAANTAWTTSYDGWGIGAWGRAAIEGLLGVVPLAPAFQRCRCTPQWPAGGVRRGRVCIALPSSRTYFAYSWDCDDGGLTIRFTGSGRTVDFELPLDAATTPGNAAIDGVGVEPTAAETDGVQRLCLSADIAGVKTLRFEGWDGGAGQKKRV